MTKQALQDWRLVKLIDVSHQVKVGLATSVTKHYAETGVPIIRNLNIKPGYLDDSDMLYLKEEFANSHPGKYVKAGDILTVHTGYIGISCVVPDRYAGAHTFTTLITTTKKKLLNPFYFSYHINSYQGEAEVQRLVAGAGRNNLNVGDFVNYRLLLPPIEEQERIVSILSPWDEAIALVDRRIEAARQRKKGLMHCLLTGRVRFPEFVQSSERFDTKFGKLPIDWEVIPLQKLIKPISRLETIRPNKEYRLIGVKWYTAGAHVHSILSGAEIKTASLSRVEENDIIYNKMWTTKAAFAVAKPEHNGTYGTTEYPQFRAKENLLWVDFLEYVFHLPRFQYDATTLCRGTTGRARLNPRDFLKLEIPLPAVEEQRRITAVLQTCDREIELLTQKRDALQRQKKGLMQRLLTGRVRVSS